MRSPVPPGVDPLYWQGYEDGESSRTADFNAALDNVEQIPQELLDNGPDSQALADWIKTLLTQQG